MNHQQHAPASSTPQQQPKKRRHRDSIVKDVFLFDVADQFFDDPVQWQRMVDVIATGRRTPKKVSLRMLDHLCSVYAYEHPCTVRAVDGSQVPLIEVYETSLDAYGKSHYDCFRRTRRLVLDKHGHRLETTLGQMLFFRDIIRNGILDFAIDNAEHIKADMQRGTQQQQNR